MKVQVPASHWCCMLLACACSRSTASEQISDDLAERVSRLEQVMSSSSRQHHRLADEISTSEHLAPRSDSGVLEAVAAPKPFWDAFSDGPEQAKTVSNATTNATLSPPSPLTASPSPAAATAASTAAVTPSPQPDKQPPLNLEDYQEPFYDCVLPDNCFPLIAGNNSGNSSGVKMCNAAIALIAMTCKDGAYAVMGLECESIQLPTNFYSVETFQSPEAAQKSTTHQLNMLDISLPSATSSTHGIVSLLAGNTASLSTLKAKPGKQLGAPKVIKVDGKIQPIVQFFKDPSQRVNPAALEWLKILKQQQLAMDRMMQARFDNVKQWLAFDSSNAGQMQQVEQMMSAVQTEANSFMKHMERVKLV